MRGQPHRFKPVLLFRGYGSDCYVTLRASKKPLSEEAKRKLMKSHASTSSGRHDRERDVLLATKIAIPRISSDLLPRSHLIRRLEEVTTHELVLISTPAGFGKTTLLASWARNTERPVAWLSLDGDDNDPARFWRYVIAAIDRVHGGIGERALSLLNASAQPT